MARIREDRGVLAMTMTVVLAMMNMLLSFTEAVCGQACCVVGGVCGQVPWFKKEWLRTERMLATVMQPRGTRRSRGHSTSNPAASLAQGLLDNCLTLWLLGFITLLTCSRLGLRAAFYLGAYALLWGPVGWSLRVALSCANGMILAPVMAYKAASMMCTWARTLCKKTLLTAPEAMAFVHCLFKATLLMAIPCAIVACLPLYIGYVVAEQLRGNSPKVEDTEAILMNMLPVALLMRVTGHSIQSACNITRANSHSPQVTVNTDVASQRGSSTSAPSTPTGTRHQLFLQLPTGAAEHCLVSAPVSPSAPVVPRRHVRSSSSSSSGSALSRSGSKAGSNSVADSSSHTPEPAASMVLSRFIDGKLPGWSC